MDINEVFALFNNLGYFGIFIISFLGSIIVFVPVPYFPILITSALDKHLDPNIISISSATGAVTAKMIIFYASYYGRRVLSDSTRKRMLPLQKLLSKYGWLGAFTAALTPIPDDLVYIPLGLAKYSPWKFATATFLGKFILNEIIVWSTAYLGRPFVEDLTSRKIDPTYAIIGTIISVAILAVIVYLSLKIDWAKLIGRWFPWALTQDKIDENGGKKEGL